MKKQKTGIICQSIIIKNSNEVLLLRRHKEEIDTPDKWDFPGGKQEFGESPEDCVIREIFEETDLEVNNPQLIKIVNYTYEKPDKIVHLMRFFYLFRIDSNEIKINLDEREHYDFRWIKKKEINQYSFPNYVYDVFRLIN